MLGRHAGVVIRLGLRNMWATTFCRAVVHWTTHGENCWGYHGARKKHSRIKEPFIKKKDILKFEVSKWQNGRKVNENVVQHKLNFLLNPIALTFSVYGENVCRVESTSSKNIFSLGKEIVFSSSTNTILHFHHCTEKCPAGVSGRRGHLCWPESWPATPLLPAVQAQRGLLALRP